MRSTSTSEASRNVLVLASHNQGKLDELRELLSGHHSVIRSIGEWSSVEPDETGETFQQNALIKAQAAFDVSGHPSLADDSGLEIDGLGGSPGVHSARWAGPDRDFSVAMRRVIEMLGQQYGSFDLAPHRATFVCALALADGQGSPTIFEGRCTGRVIATPRGDKGFGYDPIFVPEGDYRTFGEMSVNEKKRYSHRVRAFKLLQCHFSGDQP